MYDGNNDRDPPPTTAESYAGAVSVGSSRVEPHRTKPADLIGAAGMSPYRMGTALMRLASEWSSGAVPKLRALPDVKDLARQIAERRVEAVISAAPRQVSVKQKMRAAVIVQKDDIEAAHVELSRLHAQALDWQQEEAKLRFQRMKTLPTVRAGLVHWIEQKGWEDADAEHLAASVLRYFLAPKCQTCGGSGVREFAGNNRRGAGKPCAACRDNTVRGELNVPHGGRGKAVLAYLRQCTGQAAHDMREGARRLRRSETSDEGRLQHRQHEKVERLQRADAEAKADEAQDTAAVADAFRNSMGPRRKP